MKGDYHVLLAGLQEGLIDQLESYRCACVDCGRCYCSGLHSQDPLVQCPPLPGGVLLVTLYKFILPYFIYDWRSSCVFIWKKLEIGFLVNLSSIMSMVICRIIMKLLVSFLMKKMRLSPFRVQSYLPLYLYKLYLLHSYTTQGGLT